MKILAFGGSGYIAGHLLMNRSLNGFGSVVAPRSHGRKGVNLLNAKELTEFIVHTNFDLIINAAATLPKKRGGKDRDYKLNRFGPKNIIQALASSGKVVPVIHFSSATELINIPFCESPYSQSKFEGFKAFETLSLEIGIPTIRVVLHNVVGLGSRPNSYIAQVVSKAIHNQPLKIHFPERKRDFVWIKDCIFALHQVLEKVNSTILEKEPQTSMTYEIGTGIPTNLNQLANLAYQLAGSDIENISSDTVEFDPFLENVANSNGLNAIICETDIKSILKYLIKENQL